MADGKVVYEIRGEDSQLGSDLDKSTQTIKQHTSNWGNIAASAAKAIGAAFVAAVSAGAAALVSLGKAGLEYNATMEKYQTNLTTLLKGSKEAAAGLTEQIEDLAASTPLAMEDLMKSAQTLLSFGAADESNLTDTLKMIGDVAMGDAEKMQSLSLAFAQVSSTGKLTGQDLLQMINAGFNPLAEMSERLGVSIGDLKTLMSDGKLTDNLKGVVNQIQALKDSGGELNEWQQQLLDVVGSSPDAIAAATAAMESNVEAFKKSLDDTYNAAKKSYEDKEEAYKKSLDAELKAFDKAAADKKSALDRYQDSEMRALEQAQEKKLKLINEEYLEKLKLLDEEKYNRLKAIDDQIKDIQKLTEADRKAAEEKAQANKLAELKLRVENAKTAEDRRKAEADLAEYQEELRLKKVEEERAAQIELLKEQKENIIEEFDARKDALKEDYDARKEAAKEAAEIEKQTLKETHAAAKEALNSRLADERDVIKESGEESLAALKEQNAKLLAELKEANKAAAEEYEAGAKAAIGAQGKIEISADMVKQAFKSATSEGGQFFNSMENSSKTMEGRISSLKDNFSAFAGSLTEGMVPAAEKVIEALDGLVEKDSELAQSLSGVFDAVGQIVADALPVFVDLVTTLLPPLAEIAASVLPVIGNVIKALQPSIEKIAQTVLPALADAFGTVAPILAELAASVLPPLLDLVAALAEPLAEAAEKLLPPIIDIIQKLAPLFTEIATRLLPPLIDLAVAILEPLLDIVNEALGPLLDILEPLIDVWLWLLQIALEALTDLFTDMGESIKTDFGGSIDFLRGQLDGLLQFLDGVFAGEWNNIWGGLGKIVTSYVGNIIQGAQSIVNAFISMLNGMINGYNFTVSALGLDNLKVDTIDKVEWADEYMDAMGLGSGSGASSPTTPRLGQALPYLTNTESLLSGQLASAAPSAGFNNPVFNVNLTGDINMDGFKVGSTVLRSIDDVAAYSVRG